MRASTAAFPHWIGTQLRHPSGLSGRVTGSLMALANARANALAIAALRPRDGESLLELGCGPGHALQRLLRGAHGARVIGVDWSDVMLAQAAHRNRLSVLAGTLELVRADFVRLPFIDAIADAILAVNVVYFMTSSSALREARRVLRPGGRMILYATHGSIMRRWPFAGPETHRLFDHKRLSTLLSDAGFASHCIRIEGVNAGFGILGLLAVAEKKRTVGAPQALPMSVLRG
jgi:ubiquinone/menaquinone biosynthesis C-methylase UbiE